MVDEVFRKGETFFGQTLNGPLVELPPLPEDIPGNTPFAGYGHEEKIGRVEFTKVPAVRSFGYLQELLEKHVGIAKKFGIPIQSA